MADFRINVIVNPSGATRGLNRVKGQLQQTEQTADRLRGTLNRAFAFIGITAGIRQLVLLADAFTNIQNRLRTVTTGTRELAVVTSELFRISQNTRSSFESTAELYARVGLATRELGLSQRQTLNFTESLNQAIILSGASGAEAQAGLIQLSQGLASGRLSGDELRSVLEQLPAVADIISKRLGVTRGELRALGSQGKITADEIIGAFADAREELAGRFANTIPTIGQAFQVLRNSIVQAIGDFNEATNASETLARAIILLAENMGTLLRIVSAVGTALAVDFARRGIGAAITGVKALGVAIAANPIGAILTLIVGATSALIAFSDQITIASGSMVTLQDLGVATFETLGDAFETFSEFFNENFGFIGDLAAEVFGEIDFSIQGLLTATARSVDNFIGVWRASFNAIVATFQNLPNALREIFINALNSAVNVTENATNAIIRGINTINDTVGLPEITSVELSRLENSYEGSGRVLGKAITQGINDGLSFNAVSTSLTGLLSRAEEIATERIRKQRELNRRREEDLAALDTPGTVTDRGVRSDVQRILNNLQKQADALALTNREREVQNQLIQIEDRLKRQITDTEKDLLTSALQNVQNLKDQAEVLDSIQGPQNELIARQDALNALYARGAITANEFTEALTNIRLEQAQLNIDSGQGSFVDGFLIGIEQMLEAVRNFSSESGQLFGDFFANATNGFADATANAIVFGESFEDAIGNVARQALSELLSGLIRLGLQFVLNSTLGETLGVAATATGVAQAATLSAAYATPAALASLASFGANAAPASAAIASTVALSNGLASLPGFADGGMVRGPGGPRSDTIPAMLSNGEFVVNARATSRNRGLLENINRENFQNGGIVGKSSNSTQKQDSGTQQGIRIVNNLDPSIVEDFLTSSSGERVFINTVERNSSSIRQILGNN